MSGIVAADAGEGIRDGAPPYPVTFIHRGEDPNA